MHILAARRVVPPDFTAPAALSNICKKLSTPELVPPELKLSPFPLMLEKLVPQPEPFLKIKASFFTCVNIPSSENKSSATGRMKHACA